MESDIYVQMSPVYQYSISHKTKDYRRKGFSFLRKDIQDKEQSGCRLFACLTKVVSIVLIT